MSELHPQAARLLAAVAGRPAPNGVAAARAAALADLPLAGPLVPVASVRDADADGVPVRIYRPAVVGDLALVWLHGGGWVTGCRALADPQCRALAAACRAVVVSVDYRLAPEHPYPAGLEDAVTALRWTRAAVGAAHVVVGGDSAGGNLAAAACLVARDRGEPLPAAQLLIYPVTDRAANTASLARYGAGFWLDRAEMEWYWAHYLRGAADADSPYVSVLRGDLDGLPPALVYTAGCDPLCDEGEAHAARLLAAGVPVYARRFPGQLHGFFSCAGVVDAASELVADAARWLGAAAQ